MFYVVMAHVAHFATPAPTPTDSGGGSTGLDLTQIATFAQFGLLGIFFVMLVSKKFVVPKWTLDSLEETHARELKDKDDAHARELAIRDANAAATERREVELKRNLDDLQDLTRQQMLPAMIEANRLTALYVDTLAKRGGSSGGGGDGRG